MAANAKRTLFGGLQLEVTPANTETAAAEAEKVANLVARLKIDDPDAFVAIMEHYDKPLYNTLYRLLKNREDAEEALMDTFRKVYEKRYECQSETFPGWIYRIAKNAAIDMLRKRKCRVAPSSLDPESAPAAEHSHEDEVIRGLQRKAALAALTPDQRQVLVLHLYGFSNPEIAQILKKNPSAVASLLLRAKLAYVIAYKQVSLQES